MHAGACVHVHYATLSRQVDDKPWSPQGGRQVLREKHALGVDFATPGRWPPLRSFHAGALTFSSWKTVESTHDPHPGGAQTGPVGPLDLWLSARNNMGN